MGNPRRNNKPSLQTSQFRRLENGRDGTALGIESNDFYTVSTQPEFKRVLESAETNLHCQSCVRTQTPSPKQPSP